MRIFTPDLTSVNLNLFKKHKTLNELIKQFTTERKLVSQLVLILALILFGNLTVNGQSNYPKIHQPMSLIEENHKDMVEVSVMVAQCDSLGSDSVYVMIFNEKPVKDTVQFDLKIYNQDKSDSTSKSFYYEIGIGEMAIPSCGNGNLRNLVFLLPSGYDAKKSSFKVKFK